MYDRFLYTFVKVVEYGSFSKASEALFLTRVSVMKQINTLEERIGVKLFYRNNSGISLTEAGKSVYEDALKIIALCEEAETRARAIENSRQELIRVGSSFLNPGQPLISLCENIREENPWFKFKVTPFNDDHEKLLSIKDMLEEQFDVMIGINGSSIWYNSINMLTLGKFKITAAVHKKHRLAGKKIITIDDLRGETVMMVKKGHALVNDEIRKQLTSLYPDIKIMDTFYYYDMDTFNDAVQGRYVLLSFDFWKDVHPSLRTIPIAWDYAVLYGIMYSSNASAPVRKFIKAVERGIESGKIDVKEYFPEIVLT